MMLVDTQPGQIPLSFWHLASFSFLLFPPPRAGAPSAGAGSHIASRLAGEGPGGVQGIITVPELYPESVAPGLS